MDCDHRGASNPRRRDSDVHRGQRPDPAARIISVAFCALADDEPVTDAIDLTIGGGPITFSLSQPTASNPFGVPIAIAVPRRNFRD